MFSHIESPCTDVKILTKTNSIMKAYIILLSILFINLSYSFGQSKLDQLKVEINTLYEKGTTTTVFSIDVSDSVENGISKKGRANLIALGNKGLQRPGDKICVSYINDNAASPSNCYCMTLDIAFPVYTGDNDILTALRFKKQLRARKKAILSTFLNKYLDVKNDRGATEIIESVVPILTSDEVLSGNTINWYLITDLVQSSQFQSVQDIWDNGTVHYATNSGKASAEKVIKSFNLTPQSAAELDEVTVLLTQGINSGLKEATTLMPAYFIAYMAGLGYKGKVEFKSQYIN